MDGRIAPAFALASVAATLTIALMVSPIACSPHARSVQPSPSAQGSAASPTTASIAPNPESVLSEIVSFHAAGATQARVISSQGAETLVTPYAPVGSDGNGQITVLGLAPSTTYAHVVQAIGPGGLAASATVTATTAALPAALASTYLSVTDVGGAPEAGYYLVSGAGPSPFAVDAAGFIRWYRTFPQMTEEAKMQPDGTYTTFVGATQGFQPVAGEFSRFTPDGALIATYTATTPDPTEPEMPVLYTDNHEMLITTDAAGADHLHFFGYAERPTSATNTTIAAWHELLRQSPDGTVELRWKSWSRFTESDQTEPIPLPGAFDVDHANALAIDPTDGNYIASFRDVDALVKIDYETGDVLWQLGGVQNEFTFVNDPLDGFYGQHSLRVLDDGDLLIYDNGLQHDPPESRAVEYRLDTTAMTATMVWEFRRAPAGFLPIFTQTVGSVERLQSGNTLVAFALAGIVDEVDPQGGVVWQGQLLNGSAAQSAYRIRRLPSLYGFERP